MLHYRSRRQGYVAYVMGQLKEIAKVFYDQVPLPFCLSSHPALL